MEGTLTVARLGNLSNETKRNTQRSVKKMHDVWLIPVDRAHDGILYAFGKYEHLPRRGEVVALPLGITGYPAGGFKTGYVRILDIMHFPIGEPEGLPESPPAVPLDQGPRTRFIVAEIPNPYLGHGRVALPQP